MPASTTSSQIIPALGMEKVSVMDDYGTEFHLYIRVGDSANRLQSIAATLAQQSANETVLESYAATTGSDLSALKAAGLAKKASAMKAAALKVAAIASAPVPTMAPTAHTASMAAPTAAPAPIPALVSPVAATNPAH
jgi:hypothetical protein